MTIKKRTITSSSSIIESLANELADKPYGQKKFQDSLTRTTISLPSSILLKLEDMARTNKRGENDLKSVSAIIRYCIEKTLHI